MSTRTKEEELALDEKIARIQRKNEEILRRQKEIEEDKRMAEQQNAIVKLRPSTTNISRERTPALKPSNRELRHEITEDLPLQEPSAMQKSSRGSFRARGSERFRAQGDWKSSGGPPPDPKSFLYDDERDAPAKDNLVSEQKREPERGRREERDNRNDFRGGGREFQRGRRRGGMEYRGERSRRGGGGRRNEEEEWRAERIKIDEARIQRQRAADGKWRREWDSNKVLQEPDEESRHEARKSYPAHQEKWNPSTQHHGQFHTSPDRSLRHPSRGVGVVRGGRGRGRLDPTELEMPLETFQVEVLQGQTSPGQKVSGGFTGGDNLSRRHSGEVASPLTPHLPLAPPQDDFQLDPTRSVACVGNTFKISIPNTGAAQSIPKPQRKTHETRGRFKSQASYSSQSDDDSPRDRAQRGSRRQRIQKISKDQDKNKFEHNSPITDSTSAKTTLETLPVQNKPPLPPFRAEQKNMAESRDLIETKDGDESWEDVTTSGTESMGEDLSSVHSSPLRKTVVNTIIISGKQNEDLVTGPIQSLEFSQNQAFDEDMKNSYEEYFNQLEINEAEKNIEDGASYVESLELQHHIDASETSGLNISLDTSYNILLNEGSLEELVDQEKSHSTSLADSEKSLDLEEKAYYLSTKEEITTKGENTSPLVEQEGVNFAKEVCKEPASDLSLDIKKDDQGKNKVVKFDNKGKEMSEKNSAEHDTRNDSDDIGKLIQISPHNVSANLQPTKQCSDPPTTLDIKAESPSEAEVVK